MFNDGSKALTIDSAYCRMCSYCAVHHQGISKHKFKKKTEIEFAESATSVRRARLMVKHIVIKVIWYSISSIYWLIKL